MSSFWPEYVPVGVKIARAKKKLDQLRKKNPNIQPVIIEGGKIAKTWWAKAWNKNLESYADYANRIGRGRSYVKNGFVFDLKIEEGKIDALVQGTGGSPYKVSVRISPLPKGKWEKVADECSRRISSLEDIAAGRFPKDLAAFLTEQGVMFPTPKEIKMSCSCPDWATMCKHCAAALYAVGSRLDEDPMLFFKLRCVDVRQLVKETVGGVADNMLKRSGRASARVLDGDEGELGELFGIDMDGAADANPQAQTTPRAAAAAPAAAPAKKRGRPRKANAVAAVAAYAKPAPAPAATVPAVAAAPAPAPRTAATAAPEPTPAKKRGRPRKADAIALSRQATPAHAVAVVPAPYAVVPAVARSAVAPAGIAPASAPAKKRGRPRKTPPD